MGGIVFNNHGIVDKYLGDGFLAIFGAPVAVGISIHTGEVVIGNIWFDKKIDYTVIGDPVNTAFRLQAITKPISNGILISEKNLSSSTIAVNSKRNGHIRNRFNPWRPESL